MRRETRVNLIFLVVFLAISLPGAVILVHKKLQPGAPRMDQPDMIVTRLPYMTPLPAPPGVKWIVPDQTQAWLQQLTKERTGSPGVLSSAPPGPEWEPVISPDHLLQVMAVADQGSMKRLFLLVWNGQVEASASRFHVTIGGVPARIFEVRQITVPAEVRRELVRLDYVRPPGQVVWLEAESAIPTSNGFATVLSLTYDGPPAQFQTSMQFGLN